MITLSSADLNAWLISFLWPLARILALLAAAPVLGNRSHPDAGEDRAWGMLITLIVAPAIGPLPKMEPGSLEGLLVLGQQIIIGLAMGFAMRIVFSAVEMAGEIAGLQMGLGFATFFSPRSDGSTLVVGKFLGLLATLVFLVVKRPSADAVGADRKLQRISHLRRAVLGRRMENARRIGAARFFRQA